MNRFLTMLILLGGLRDAADSGAGGAAAGVAGDGSAAAGASDGGTGAAAGGAAGGGSAGAGGSDGGAGAASAATGGGDDLMAQLEAIMSGLDGQQGGQQQQQQGQPQAGQQQAGQQQAGEGAIPDTFRAALEISPLVTTPEAVQQAVRAADEVWKVAAGQLPARAMLEEFRESNPQQYPAIVEDLAAYIGEVTGQNPVQAQEETALVQLAQSHPQIFAAVQQFVKQNAGVELGGAPDPREARLSAIEQQFAAEQEARNAAAWNERVMAARTKATEFLKGVAKGTFAEGHEAYFLTQMGSKAGIPEAQMIDMILQGNTTRLEAAYKAVVKDETARLKAYNANLIRQHRALRAAAPGGGARQASAGGAPARNEGESDIAYATRLWEAGKTA